jgi:U3 small nucleolar RNA-associated protein 22
VDLGESLDAATLDAIRTRFAAWRKIDPVMNSVVFFAASDIDQDGVTWTQHEMPSKVVAARISALAKAAVKLIREKGTDLDMAELFHPSLAPYDFVIELDPNCAGRERSNDLVKFKNLQELSIGANHKSSAAIISFVQEIQASFSNSMLLFHGDGRCRRVAGLWNPQMKKPKGLTLKMAYSTTPCLANGSNDDSSGNVTINATGILNEIARLGDGLVRTIYIQEGEHRQ